MRCPKHGYTPGYHCSTCANEKRIDGKKPLDKAMEEAERCEALYLEYFNDYLTIEKFAEHKGMQLEEAIRTINIGRAFNHAVRGKDVYNFRVDPPKKYPKEPLPDRIVAAHEALGYGQEVQHKFVVIYNGHMNTFTCADPDEIPGKIFELYNDGYPVYEIVEVDGQKVTK